MSDQVEKPHDHIWVRCPDGHGDITHQYFDDCGCCSVCGAIMISCDAPPSLSPSAFSRELRKRADQLGLLLVDPPRPHPDAELLRRAADVLDATDTPSPTSRKAAIERAARALCTAHYVDRFKKPAADPHVQANVEANWCDFEEVARTALAADTPPPVDHVEVETVECVSFANGYEEPADPIYRIVIDGYCADFETEAAAQNFANAINSLIAPPATDLDGWQDIITAPIGQSVIICTWWKHNPSSAFRAEGYLDRDTKTWRNQDGSPISEDRTQPTHWMEIQEAPRTTLSPVPRLAIGDNHPDAQAVDRFAAAMKAKLAKKRAEGRSGWDDPEQCHIDYLHQLLHEQFHERTVIDPVDIANLAMMIHERSPSDE